MQGISSGWWQKIVGFAVVLAVGGGIAWIMSRQTPLQAGPSAFQPQVAALAKEGKLQVHIALPPEKNKAPQGSLSLELLDAEGKVATSQEKALADGAVTASFDHQANKNDKTRLRITYKDQKSEVALQEVLLAKGQETTLSAGQDFFAGSQAALLCSVNGIQSLTRFVPLAGSAVEISLFEKDGKVHDLYKGQTGFDGKAGASFDVPELPAGSYKLQVKAKSVFGEEILEHQIKIRADAKILLTSDKPIYQPGQMMHIRAMVLRPFDMKPVANKEMLFEVEDSKGNKVFKRTLKTSEFGIASVDFQLADEVNMGDYHLRAVVGQANADKTVNVKRYVLPKFKVNVTADKRFYLPKEKVQIELQSDYFFGKPVAGGKIEVTASTFDVEFKKFHTWKGETDAQGHAKLDFQLPDYFVGQPLQKGSAMVKVDVQLTDTADHVEKIAKTYTVSDQPIKVSLIPEGGKLVPGMENRIFAAAIYPDGSPAPDCSITLMHPLKDNPKDEKKVQILGKLKTNQAGLAEFKVTPQNDDFRTGGFAQQKVEFLGGQQFRHSPQVIYDVRFLAQDAKGNQASASQELTSQPLGENVLLRLDKAIYKPGDSMNIDIRTSAGLPTVYLDIVRGGQILLSRWYEVKDAQATQKLDLPPSVFGSLEVHAYQTLASGEIIRDSRVVYVQPSNDLKIDVKADQDEYLPGQGGRIRFLVTDSQGNPAAAALGVIIVDEAVFALQDMQPGLEKVYFTLQEELLKPQVQIKYSETVDNLIRQPVLPAPQQQIAEVLLTAVKLPPPPRWEVNPAFQRKQQVQNQLMQIGHLLFNHAWSRDIAFMEWDKTAKSWVFRKGVLAQISKENNMPPDWLKGPFGEKLTLEDVAALEKGFSPNNLAEAVTLQRMQQVTWIVMNYVSTHQKKFFKNKQWDVPTTVLDEAIKSQKNPEAWLKDAWGNPLALVKRGKDSPNVFGPQFDKVEIVSAGPDGKLSTADDVSSAKLQKFQHFGGGMWWTDDRDQLVKNRLRGEGWQWRHRRNMMLMDMAEERAAFGGPGGPVPMAAPALAGGVPPMAPMQARDVQKSAKGGEGGGGAGTGAAPITKVREYFPETMLWQPALITDHKGEANLALDFADSITTWRLSASANSKGGALGGVNVPLKVFQEFFVDVDLPVTLTQSDEVAFPVAVYNYLKTPQTVKVELQKEAWFELIDDVGLTRSLEVKPNEVTSVKFRVRANKIGFQPVTIKAYGSKRSDAVKRLVEVVPNGQKFEKVVTDRLNGKISQVIDVPEDAVADASKLMVRIYPGVMSQIVEGLDGMLRMPGGCFEQTSSSAFPNILIVDYLRKNKIASPELMMKCEQYLNVGYQRLLTFERPGGGFDWWGREEPLIWLSAYGLQEFSDMAKVYPIDRGIIDRTQAFLIRKMDKDGTWSNIGATHGETIASMGNPKLLLTSYVVWSLIDSGYPKENLKNSIAYIRGNLADVNNNAYVLALAANALASYDPKDDSTLEALQKLDKLRKEIPDWKACNFPVKGASLAYSHGDGVTIETTALAAIAMVKTGQFTNQVNQILTYLVKAKQGNGTWGSTQATILSLKALLAGMGGNNVKGNIPFTILVDGKEAAKGKVNEDNSDLMQTFDLKGLIHTGANKVEIQVEGETPLMYQIVGRYFQAWPKEKVSPQKPVIEVDVAYDRTKLSTNDILKAKATLKYHGTMPTYMVMLDLGIAPGFNVDPGDFTEMVDKGRIKKFSITSRQVILYLGDVKPGDVLTFEYSLRPRFPLRAKTGASVAYEYNTPANRAESAPVELVVEERK